MVYQGRVTKGGKIRLDDPAALPTGTRVSVRPVKAKRAPRGKAKKSRTLYDRMKPFIGLAKGVPTDLAENHDHYLYGRPKR